jgi:hypothetical protein
VTTIELLSILSEQHKGWNTNGERGILPHLNAAHFILETVGSEQHIYYDGSTGKFPSVDTTDGVFQYDLPDEIWRLEDLLIELTVGVTINTSVLNTLVGFDYGSRRATTKKIDYRTYAGIEYARVPYVRSQLATEDDPASIIFSVNPGDSTDYYFVRGIKKPTQIVSESIQVDTPPPYDYQFLIPAASTLIRGIEHGNYAEARAYIENVLKPQYARVRNAGEQGFDFEADDRGF